MPEAVTRWCILRTSGGRTLALADSLMAAGIEAWTPRRTLRREKPGRCRLIDGSKPVVEIEAPILPTIVFVPAGAMAALATIAADPASPHPPFSLFRHGDRYPLIGVAELRGLRQAEQEAADLIQAIRTAETRAEAERIRIAGIRRQAERERAARRAARERLQALRGERRDFDAGLRVVVAEAPALAGKVGRIVEAMGRTALVSFGGAHAWTIEAWRLSPFDVDEDAARKSTAA
jgi:hypothetical protein